MQCSKQRLESKITVFLWKRMCESCFCSHGRPSTTGYWPNLVTYSSRTLQYWRCVLKAKAMRTVCVIAPEKMILPSATVRLQGCCIGISFNPCSCANKKLTNAGAVAPQSAIATVLNKVPLLVIVQSNTMWSHSLLATGALADINNPNPVGLRERLYSRTVCFPMCCLTIMPLCLQVLLSSCGFQLHSA